MERSLEGSVRQDPLAAESASAEARNWAAAPPNRRLPRRGRAADDILAEIRARAAAEDPRWEEGRVSGAVYHGGRAHLGLLNDAYAAYGLCNPLHPDIWPSAAKFESEIISMVARMVDGGDAGVCGAVTSGGTESIFLAIKAHRERAQRRGVARPELVAAVSAHAAVDKACALLCITLVQIPMDPDTFEMDVVAARRAVSANTILIYASAPSFAHGAVDDVLALAGVAAAAGCGLHVDCCLGGFVLPFAPKDSGLPPFDFGVAGVTSMSVDTHKYGYASKGTSVVLYRDADLRAEQYFCFPNWTGGLYATPTLAGSRSGGLLAACWASLLALGEDGYRKAAAAVLQTAAMVAAGVAAVPGLAVLGRPQAMVVCFGAAAAAPGAAGGLDIYRVGDGMTKRGWSLNALQRPPCVHLCVTLRTVGRHDAFLADLCAAPVRRRVRAALDGIGGGGHGNAAIYGVAATMPPGPVNVMLRAYTDVML
ncbi:unnamed protein product, partial [Phaeothamnion confervicola]